MPGLRWVGGQGQQDQVRLGDYCALTCFSSSDVLLHCSMVHKVPAPLQVSNRGLYLGTLNCQGSCWRNILVRNFGTSYLQVNSSPKAYTIKVLLHHIRFAPPLQVGSVRQWPNRRLWYIGTDQLITDQQVPSSGSVTVPVGSNTEIFHRS